MLKDQSQNDQVLDLMAKSPMRLGGIDLIYDRSPKFQELLKAQGENFLTLLSLDQKKYEKLRDSSKVTGCFSLSTGMKYIQGKKVCCAYIGDFRTNGDRRVAKLWRAEYKRILEIFKNEEALKKPQYFLTAVLKKNKEALRNLTGSKKNYGFYYHQLKEIDMINILGKSPWKKRTPLRVEVITELEIPLLMKFLDSKEKNKNFGAIFDESSDNCWRFREKNWQGAQFREFLVIKNPQGKLVACCLLWNPSILKRMSVSKISLGFQILLKFFNLLGLNFPALGKSLDTVYLTHLNWDSNISGKEVVESFILEALERFPNAHMISFADFGNVSDKLGGFLKQRTSVVLYEVSNQPIASFQDSEEVSFEMSLV